MCNTDPILTGFRGPYGKILARGRRIDRASARSIRWPRDNISIRPKRNQLILGLLPIYHSKNISFTRNGKQINSYREFIAKIVSDQTLICLWFTEIRIFLSNFLIFRIFLPLTMIQFLFILLMSSFCRKCFLERPKIWNLRAIWENTARALANQIAWLPGNMDR